VASGSATAGGAAPGASGSAAPEKSKSDLPPDTRIPAPKRDLPDYDGRGERGTTLGHAALWVPRVLLFPLYLVTDYVLREPLGLLVSTADKNHWPVEIINFFTFGPDRQVGIFPTAFIDFGMRPSVGLYGYVNRFLAEPNRLGFQAGFWGPSWLSFSLNDRITVAKDSYVTFGASWNKRPDQPFYGLGPNSRESDRARYGVTVFDAPLRFDLHPNGALRLTSVAGARITRFHGGDCCSDPDVSVYFAEGRYAPPPGYPDGYDALYTRLELAADSRPRRPASQTGVRADVYAEEGMDPRASSTSSWFKWGGSAGAYLDLGMQRTIGLKASALFVESVSGETPFLEQVSLGGYGLMRGYLQNRLVDRSAAVAELEYRWPVWVFADGTLQGSVGNVFGPHLDNFSAELLRLSAAVGIRSNNTAERQLELLVGFGSETFGSGGAITSLRLFLGGTNGF
jgi:hypothetical protein